MSSYWADSFVLRKRHSRRINSLVSGAESAADIQDPNRTTLTEVTFLNMPGAG